MGEDAAPRAGSSGGWTTSTSCVSGGDQDEDLVKDGWTDIFRNLTGTAAKQAARKLGRRLTPEERDELMELADYRKMNQVRARVDEIVEGPGDRREAEALVPPVLQAAVLPRRVPADLQPAQRDAGRHRRQGRAARSPRTASSSTAPRQAEYEVDCLVFATGFEVGHHLHPPRRLRHHRPARHDAVARSGPKACAPCTACRATASRTASSSASPRRR